MQTKLSPYCGWAHQGGNDWALLGEWGPPAAVVMGVDAELVRQTYAACGAGSLMFIRDYGATDSPGELDAVRADPEGSARRHVDYFAGLWSRFDFIPENQRFALLANELGCSPENPGEIETFNRYWTTAIVYATERRLPLGALKISNGWPHNDGKDRPVCWEAHAGPVAAIRWGRSKGVRHVVVLHEYDDPIQPVMQNWGWTYGRALWFVRQNPDLEVFIGEFGADAYVSGRANTNRGFQAYITFEAMLERAIAVDLQYQHYPQVLGIAWYLYDFQDRDRWFTFDFRHFIIDDPRGNPLVTYARNVRDGKIALPAPLPLPGPWGGPVVGGSLPPVVPPVVPPLGDLRGMLLAEADARQVLQLNPAAALQKAIYAAGLIVTSPEFEVDSNGVRYVAQRAESAGTGAVRVFYCVKGDWGQVRNVSGEV